MPIEVIYAIRIIVSGLGILALAIGLVYLFGGKKFRKHMREDW